MIQRLAALFAVAAVLLAASSPAAAGKKKAAPPPSRPDPQAVVEEAKARAVDPIAQGLALARLAWPAEDGDPAVAAAAREELIGFGRFGIDPIAAASGNVRDSQRADAVAALLECYAQRPAELPAAFLPALETAVWYGPREARERAIPPLAQFRYTPALLPIIDAALEDRALLPLAVKAVSAMQDARARFFLDDTLMAGPPDVRSDAAIALARIGGDALFPLKKALRSDDPATRLAAATAILPVARTDDLSALYEYLSAHSGDDPIVVQAIRDTAAMLEEVLAAQHAMDAATPPSDL